MKRRNKLFFSTITIILSILLTVTSITIFAQTTVIQIKTYNKELQPFSNLEISLDGKNYVKTGSLGSIITNIDTKLLPPKVIYFTNNNLEAESWNYSKGVLEIIVRNKSFDAYTITLLDTLGNPITNAGIIISVNNKKYDALSDDSGIAVFLLPLNSKINKKRVSVNGYIVDNLTLNAKNGTLSVYSKPIKKVDQSPIIVKQNKVPGIDLIYLDSIKSLTEFYAYLKSQDLSTLSEADKIKIDTKFKDLMKTFKDSLGVEENLIGNISDSSLVNEDIAFLTKQASHEGKIIKESRSKIDESFRLIHEKLVDGGSNLSDEDRQKILGDIEHLGRLLDDNEALFSRNQENYRSSLDQLKNQLLNIKNLEQKLSESELQRLEERKAFRRQIFIYTVIIAGLVLLILLFAYLVRKFNQQKKKVFEAHKEIQRINNNLENIVAEKTESLVQSNHELDTFLYHTSHKLKAPITTIIGLSYVAKLTLNNEQYELFEKATETAKKMGQLLNKLTMINELNQTEHLQKEIDITYLIDKVCFQFSELIKSYGITIEKEILELTSYRTNPALLEIVLTNIVENSLQYSSYYSEEPKVKFKVDKIDNWFRICITDNGEGISDDIKENIWNMFYIGNIKSQGNGLGLYIARRAIELIHGQVFFESFEKENTTIVIQLPIEQIDKN